MFGVSPLPAQRWCSPIAASASAADQLAVETGAQALQADAGARDELIAAIRDAGPIDIFVYIAGVLVFGDPSRIVPITEPDYLEWEIGLDTA